MLDVGRARVEERRELSVARHDEADLWDQGGGGEDRLQPVQRDELPDEQDVRPLDLDRAGREQIVLRPDERDLDPLLRQAEGIAEVVGVRLGVRDDEIREPERRPVERPHDGRRRRARREDTAIAGERVGQGDERVEHHRPAAGDATRRRHVGVPRIADHDHVRLCVAQPGERELSTSEPAQRAEAGRPVVAAPDPAVPLHDRHARRAQAGDHLHVPRGRAVVRPEVERLQRRISSTSFDGRSSAARKRSRCWLVTSSDRSPRERNWIPTTTSRTPRRSSGRLPIASPVSFTIVR